MRNYPNIEKSAFHIGEYVGYSGLHVWRIKKSNSSFGTWSAHTNNQRLPWLHAFSLASMSEKLTKVEGDQS